MLGNREGATPETRPYRGEVYDCDETTGIVSGNPANAPIVVDVFKSVKHMARADGGGDCKHSVAMSASHMEKVHTYITNELKRLPSDPGADSHGQRTIRVKCLFYLAFSTTGWYLWTRHVSVSFLFSIFIYFKCWQEF